MALNTIKTCILYLSPSLSLSLSLSLSVSLPPSIPSPSPPVMGPKGLQLVRATDVSLLVQWQPVQGAEYYMLTHHPKDQEKAVQEVRLHQTRVFSKIRP